MEEWVGSIWHKFITKKASTEFDEARVHFEEIRQSLGVVFRALGGDPAKRVEPAYARDYITRRSFLQKVSGSNQQMSLAWQDEQSLRLPESIAVLPERSLNRDLYIWLAVLASQHDGSFRHWAVDNQNLVKSIINSFPLLEKRYQRLADSVLALREDADSLPKEEREMELAIRQAIKEPGSVASFPAVNFAPKPVALWLYPSAKVDSVVATDHEIDEEQDGKSVAKKAKSVRKKAERVESPNERDGMMIFRLESMFSWSEFANLDRGCDDSDDEDSQRVADDLDKITVSKQQNQRSANIKLDLDLPSASEDDIPLGDGIHLPEYDYRSQQLQPKRCLLQPMMPKDAHPKKLPVRLRKTANKIRSQFEHLQSLRYWLKAQPHGEELDLTSCVDFFVERKVNATQERGLFQSFRGNNRDLACLLLADLSMSTDAHLDNDNRVIDVVKDSMLLFGEALQTVGDSFAMYGFSSVKRTGVRFNLLKNFNEPYNDTIRGRVQALRPGFYTRMGAAIRQATNIIAEQRQTQKLLLIVTDGKPNDIDHYEGRFGIEDTRQAILDAKRRGLKPFCITIDTEAQEYLPYLFGHDGFSVVVKPTQLPQLLPQLYHQITH